MACSCSSNTLRLFIRSLARIDLESAPQHRNLRAHTNTRTFTTYASRRFQNSQKFNSSAGDNQGDADKWLPFTEGAPAPESTTSTGWPQRKRAAGNDYQPDIVFEKSGVLEGYDEGRHSQGDFGMAAMGAESGDYAGEDAYMEITDASLDSLVAESRSARQPREARGSRAATRDAGADQSAMIRRMAKPKTRDMQIHFSAPRKEPIGRAAGGTEEPAFSTARRAPEADDGRPAWAGEDWEDRRPGWAIQKAALKEKFPEGWNPRKRLSPDALDGIRALHKQFPEQYTSAVLADKFEVSVEAIRRILRTKWQPNEEEELDRKKRWFSRGEKVWGRMADMGMKPPKQWREAGVGYGEEGGVPKWDRGKAKKAWSSGVKAKRTFGQKGLEGNAGRDHLDLSDRIM